MGRARDNERRGEIQLTLYQQAAFKVVLTDELNSAFLAAIKESIETVDEHTIELMVKISARLVALSNKYMHEAMIAKAKEQAL